MSLQSILSILFAFLGLIFGAFIAIFTERKHDKYVKYAECLASGFMLAVVFFDLLPNASEKTQFITVFLGLLAGIVIILLFNKISFGEVCTKFPKYAIIKRNKQSDMSCELQSVTNLDNKRLMRNLTTAFAVALHNIPEGIALGSLNGQEILVSTAILIALHNIPEGVAMSIPLAKIGVKWHKIMLFAFLTGACTVLGWGAGILIGQISDEVIAFLLAISSGAMLQIVFGEMLAESENKNNGNITLAGLMIGMIIATLV